MTEIDAIDYIYAVKYIGRIEPNDKRLYDLGKAYERATHIIILNKNKSAIANPEAILAMTVKDNTRSDLSCWIIINNDAYWFLTDRNSQTINKHLFSLPHNEVLYIVQKVDQRVIPN